MLYSCNCYAGATVYTMLGSARYKAQCYKARCKSFLTTLCVSARTQIKVQLPELVAYSNSETLIGIVRRRIDLNLTQCFVHGFTISTRCVWLYDVQYYSYTSVSYISVSIYGLFEESMRLSLWLSTP